ncbi:MAG: energy-coupling factor transporter ATP-binding protein EcfA2 [Cocleimonas sp.]|jgi:energy-coupling factor transporter ATP-binding protein EcfA2
MKNYFNSFNAKHLKSEDIANKFVSSSLFLETAKNNHTILVGPRGSGKTTFLRMLSNNTLSKWKDYQHLIEKGSINYEGIYVPGDLVWGEMIKSLSEAGLDNSYSEVFAYSAFLTHVLQNAIEGIEFSLKSLPIDEVKAKEVALYEAMEQICTILKLKPVKISISRIRHELALKMNVLGEYSRFLSITGAENFDLHTFNEKVPYAYSDLKITLESIFEAIDSALERPEQRWAILLDEFEIAPHYLLNKVISSMRSSAKKIIFKVALVPCGFHQAIKSQTSSLNDYSVVELWYAKKGESSDFCKGIVAAMYGVDDPAERLGVTKFGSTLKGGSEHWLNSFNELYSKDLSFRSFVRIKKINYKQELLKNTATSNLVRKISPVVAFRNAFLNVSGKRKGRKALSEFYSGWDAISTISEGNPRWLLSVLNSLFIDSKNISAPVQMQKVSRSTNSYCAMLKTLPLSNNMGLSTKEPIFELLKKIGAYFNSRLIDDDFMSSVPTTFIVDKSITSDIESALMIAWNYGAIVSIDTDNIFGTYDSLEGMRFRLSHLLAPEFELNLTTGPFINLSTILNYSFDKVKKQRSNESIDIQPDLFS